MVSLAGPIFTQWKLTIDVNSDQRWLFVVMNWETNSTNGVFIYRDKDRAWNKPSERREEADI